MGLLCMRWYHAHAAFVAQSRVVITMSTSARHKHERARSLPRPDKLTGIAAAHMPAMSWGAEGCWQTS